MVADDVAAATHYTQMTMVNDAPNVSTAQITPSKALFGLWYFFFY